VLEIGEQEVEAAGRHGGRDIDSPGMVQAHPGDRRQLRDGPTPPDVGVEPPSTRNGEFTEGFARVNMSYRSGWYVIDDAPKTLFAIGIRGQNLFVDRTNRIVIAKIASQNSPIDYQAVSFTAGPAMAARYSLNP